MKKAFVLLALAAVSCASPAPRPVHEALVCCGQSEVFILKFEGTASPRKVWSWKASGRSDLPERLWNQFRSTDECKPVDGGRRILITSSSGGVALVTRATGEVDFYGSVRNAHSAELLPGNRMVVAGSVGDTGNRLVLYDLARSDTPVFVDELVSGHGVVWDSGRQVLWALGGTELRSYRLANWETGAPRLQREATHVLPDPGGHDLRAIPGSPDLVVTTNARVFRFDRDAGAFRPFDGIEKAAKVKSVDVNPRTGRIAYIKAEERWWAFRVRLMDPDGEVPLPKERLYKVRWIGLSDEALDPGKPSR